MEQRSLMNRIVTWYAADQYLCVYRESYKFYKYHARTSFFQWTIVIIQTPFFPYVSITMGLQI